MRSASNSSDAQRAPAAIHAWRRDGNNRIVTPIATVAFHLRAIEDRSHLNAQSIRAFSKHSR
jgi:hypothetical protein